MKFVRDQSKPFAESRWIWNAVGCNFFSIFLQRILLMSALSQTLDRVEVDTMYFCTEFFLCQIQPTNKICYGRIKAGAVFGWFSSTAENFSAGRRPNSAVGVRESCSVVIIRLIFDAPCTVAIFSVTRASADMQNCRSRLTILTAIQRSITVGLSV